MSACDLRHSLSGSEEQRALLTGATHESHVTIYEKLAKCRQSQNQSRLWPYYVYRLRTLSLGLIAPALGRPTFESDWEQLPVGNFDNNINASGAGEYKLTK